MPDLNDFKIWNKKSVVITWTPRSRSHYCGYRHSPSQIVVCSTEHSLTILSSLVLSSHNLLLPSLVKVFFLPCRVYLPALVLPCSSPLAPQTLGLIHTPPPLITGTDHVSPIVGRRSRGLPAILIYPVFGFLAYMNTLKLTKRIYLLYALSIFQCSYLTLKLFK